MYVNKCSLLWHVLAGKIMGFLTDYIKEILGFVVISGLIVNILPDNKNLKYIKLFTGLVLTLLLISPVLKLGNVDIESILMSQAGAEVSTDKIKKDINEKLDEEYMKISEEYISELVESYGLSVRRIRADKDNVRVYLEPPGSSGKSIDVGKIVLGEGSESDNYQELKEIISSKLSILPEQVYVYETG